MNQESQPLPGASAALPDADVAVVRAELDAIVTHPLFSHSKRCQAFLRYVVEQTIAGHGADLKERTVGVEALGRPASYDTGQDPVVRTTAAEVRKRLAQYYQQHATAETRVTLPLGSYVPSFERASGPDAPVAHPVAHDVALPRRTMTRRYLLAAAVVLACVTGVAYALRASGPSEVDQFWTPVLRGNGTVKVLVGPVGRDGVAMTDVITIDAAGALSRIAALFQRRDQPFDLKPVHMVGFADVRTHPVVTIGLFNNVWTRKVNESLRFRPGVPGTSAIVDTANPTTPGWSLRFDGQPSLANVVEDFALVSRVLDAHSGQWVLALGGIRPYGTAAAGEFVTSPDHLRRFVADAPSDWPEMNVQIVLATNVHDGAAGPPRVVASHWWR